MSDHAQCARCHKPINTGDLTLTVHIADVDTDTPLAAHLTCPELEPPDTTESPRDRVLKNAWQGR